MSNQATNQSFLSAVDVPTQDEILLSIATHYGITKEDALQEVTHEEAENLLDYLTGSVRMATSALMRRQGLA